VIYGIIELGNTPNNRLLSNGISSYISLGTNVSHTLLISIDYSKVLRSVIYSPLSSNVYYASLFILPALTNTLLSALNPKS